MTIDSSMQITREGNDLLFQALRGAKIEFTRAILSNGRNWAKEVEVPIDSVENEGSLIDISIRIDNEICRTSLDIADIYLYARLRSVPESEIKFAYIEFDEPDFLIPAREGYEEIDYDLLFSFPDNGKYVDEIDLKIRRYPELDPTFLEGLENTIESGSSDLEREINRLKRKSHISGRRDARKDRRDDREIGRDIDRVDREIDREKRKRERDDRAQDRKIRRAKRGKDRNGLFGNRRDRKSGRGRNRGGGGLFSTILGLGGNVLDNRKDSKKFKEIDEIEYQIYTSLNALAMLVGPPNTKTARKVDRWLNNERLRRRDWNQFKRMSNRKKLFRITNKIKSLIKRPAKYASNKKLVNLGRFIMLLPVFFPIFGPIVLILAIIAAIFMAIPSLIAMNIVNIVMIIALFILSIAHILLFFLEIVLFTILTLFVFVTSIVNGLIIFQPLVFFFDAIVLFFYGIVTMFFQIIAAVLTAILMIIAVLILIPTLGIGSFILIWISLLIWVVALVIAVTSSMLSFFLFFLFLPFTVLNVIWSAIAIVYSTVVEVVSVIFVLLALAICSIFLVFVGAEAGILVVIFLSFLIMFTLPLDFIIGPLLIHFGKRGSGSMIIDRNIQFRDRNTRRINRRRKA